MRSGSRAFDLGGGLVSLLLVASSLGCGGVDPPPAAAPQASAPPSAPGAPPKVELDEVRWGLVSGAPQGLKIPLPEPKTWLTGESTDGWFGAKHPITSSEVRARTWSHRGPADKRGCEEDIPSVVGYARAKLNEIDRMGLRAPKGFETEVVVGTKVPVEAGKGPSAPPPPGERVVVGVILAVGVRGRRCFAYFYETRSSGATAERDVGQRLALMVERSLQRVLVTSELDPDIPREPKPSTMGGPEGGPPKPPRVATAVRQGHLKP